MNLADAEEQRSVDFYQTRLDLEFKATWGALGVWMLYGFVAYHNLNYATIPVRVPFGLVASAGACALVTFGEILHFFRYRRVSRAIIVAIDQVNRLIEVDGTCRSKKYHFDEIRCITRTWAKNTRSDRRSKPRCGDFFFYEIEFENHDELIITGLMTDAPRLGFGPKQIEIDTYRIAWLKLKGRHIVNLEVNREPTSMKQGEHFSARGQAGH